MVIFLFFLISFEKLIKHYYSQLYLCDNKKNDKARYITACSKEKATNWLIQQKENKFTIKSFLTGGILKITSDTNSLSKNDSELFDIVEDENKIKLKRGYKCIEYNEKTNNYNLVICNNVKDQYFSMIDSDIDLPSYKKRNKIFYTREKSSNNIDSDSNTCDHHVGHHMRDSDDFLHAKNDIVSSKKDLPDENQVSQIQKITKKLRSSLESLSSSYHIKTTTHVSTKKTISKIQYQS